MPNIMHSNGESLDLDTAHGQYRYVAQELCRHGIGSNYLAALAHLHSAASLSEERDAENQILRNALREALLRLCFWSGWASMEPKVRNEDLGQLNATIQSIRVVLGQEITGYGALDDPGSAGKQ